MRKHYPLNSQGAEDAGQLPWTNGVPSTGTQGSYPSFAIVTDAEAEILAAIDAAGLVRNGADLTQLIQAASRGIWLGLFGGTATALTATMPNSVVIPSLQGGVRVRGIAASNYPGGGGTLALTGVGNSAASVMSCPIVGSDGASTLAAGAWAAGQFLTFDIDASGNARFAPGAGSVLDSRGIVGSTPVPFYASGTFVATSTRTRALMWAAGGGGGGAGSTNGNRAGAPGGGGGEYAEGVFPTVIGQPYSVIVGVGGTPGSSSPSNGGNGGLSSFGSFISCIGGAGSTGVLNQVGGSLAAGGSGGTGGAFRQSGSGGGNAIDLITSVLNGLGGVPGFGGSPQGPNVNGPGVSGRFPGGGGTGGSSITNGQGYAGGPGANGLVILFP